MIVCAITFVWMFVLPPPEGLFPASLPVAESPSDARPIDADDEGNAARYASYKRVLLRGAIDPEIIGRAKTLVTLPMGEERVIVIKDKPYAFRLEQHYHPPGFANGPTGWHKGVTVYALVEDGGAD